MANGLYDPARFNFLTGNLDWNAPAVVKAALVRGYTPDFANHGFVSDVTAAGGTLVATSGALAVTASAGIADASDVTFPAVPTGAAISGILLFMSSAVTGGADVAASAQRLIGYIDTATGLPVTPNGSDITVAWDNGVNKIFKL